MIKNEKIGLTILFLLSFFLSTYLFFHTYIISMDGAFQYIPIARDFVSGLYRKALTHNQQPLYSFIVAFVYRWVGDFELAGKLVSSFFGILMIFPVYFLGKRIFNEKVAFVSTFLLIIHPYVRRFSADVLKESTYLFFLASALWFSWRTIQGEKRYPYLFIPLFSALTYLVRPDGIEVILVVFFYLLFIRKFSPSKERWIIILLLILSSLLLFSPYLIHLKETTGIWTLSRAKTMEWFLGLREVGYEISWAKRILFAIKKLNLEILSVYHPLYIFLLFIGFIKRASSRFENGEKYLLSFFILHYIILFFFALNLTEWNPDGTIKAVNFSGRHVLSLLVFSIYWVGEGVLGFYDWINKKLEFRLFKPLESSKRSMMIWALLFILILAIILPKTLKPQRYERLPEKWAGEWLRREVGKGQLIFTTVPRVAFYADGHYERIRPETMKMDEVLNSMKQKNGLYLVIQEKERFDNPLANQVLQQNFVELRRFEGKGMEKVILYKRVN